MTHLALLEKWRDNGDADAFREIATAYAPLVYGVCRRVLHNRHDAEDAAQECFLTLARTTKLPRRNFAAWLHVVAMNQARKRLRTEQRRRQRESDYAMNTSGCTDPTWDDLSPLIDDAIANLPEKLREPVVAHYLEGESHANIAFRLGTSRQTVTYRIGKGIEGIRRTLKNRHGVTTSAAALTGLLSTHAADASAPAALLTSIGKLAVAGPATHAASAGLIGSGILSIKAVGVTAFGIALITIGFALLAPERSAPPLAQTTQQPPAAPASSTTSTESTSSTRLRGGLATGLGNFQFSAASADAPETQTPARPARSRVSGTVVLPDGRPYIEGNVGMSYLNSRSIVPVVKTDTSGRFTFTNVKPGELSVRVGAQSNKNELARITAKPGEDITGLRLVYGTEGDLAISGHVVDTDGEPIENVEVTAWGNVLRETKTNADGAFTLEYLLEGEYNTTARAESYTSASLLALAGDANVMLVMEGLGNIEGRVLDAQTGKPIPEFEAGFINGHRGASSIESTTKNLRSIEDENGRFRFEDVYVGDLTVTARAPGYEQASVFITLPEYETVSDIELELSPAEPLHGRVVDAHGAPIAKARIGLGEIEWPTHQHVRHVAETDADGRFTIDSPPPELTLVTAYRDGYAPSCKNVSDGTTITLHRPAVVRASVSEGEEPVDKASVRVLPKTEARLGYIAGASTGPDGVALVDQLPAGPVRVQAFLTDERSLVKYTTINSGETTDVSFDFVPAEAALEGRITVHGQPAERTQASLHIETNTGHEQHEAIVDKEGYYRFPAVPQGDATMVIEARGNDTLRRPRVHGIELRAGEMTIRNVDLTGEGRIEGRFVGVMENGFTYVVTALEGAMTLENAQEAMRIGAGGAIAYARSGYANPDGTYVIDALEPGAYTVVAVARDKADWSTRHYLAAAQVTVTNETPATVDFQCP